jgi:hypothetical protein
VIFHKLIDFDVAITFATKIQQFGRAVEVRQDDTTALAHENFGDRFPGLTRVPEFALSAGLLERVEQTGHVRVQQGQQRVQILGRA